jgi:hypothetical protein
VLNFRIEYFRDRILTKACPCHMALEDAIRTAEEGLKLYKAQLALIRDADNREVARLHHQTAPALAERGGSTRCME